MMSQQVHLFQFPAPGLPPGVFLFPPLRNTFAVTLQRAVRALMPTDRSVWHQAEGGWAACCQTGQELMALGHMARCDALEPAHRAYLLEETKALAAAYAGESCEDIERAVDLFQPARPKK